MRPNPDSTAWNLEFYRRVIATDTEVMARVDLRMRLHGLRIARMLKQVEIRRVEGQVGLPTAYLDALCQAAWEMDRDILEIERQLDEHEHPSRRRGAFPRRN